MAARHQSPRPSAQKGSVAAVAPSVDTNSEKPPARREGVYFADGTEVVRRQTRPIGEFGGNFGTGFWLLFIPACIWYVYGICVMNKGALMVPNGKFWHDLYYGLPDGIAIRPTWTGTGAFALWIVFQVVLELVVPGKIDEGVTQKNGRRLKYPMNGLASFFLSHAACYVLSWFGYIEPFFVWKQMGALLTGAVIISSAIALWIYIDFGLLWWRHVDDEEFEEDWGVFNLSECINDYFLGVARNPRIFRFLKVPLDVKRFTNARPSLTGWVICNQSYLAAIYMGCRLQEDTMQPFCEETGDWSRVGGAAVLITLAHWYYIFDYNWNEPAYLTTTDIRHDLYGWMLSYGCMGFLCWYYSIAFLGHIAAQPTPINDNPIQLAVGCVICTVGMILFRLTNIQKHQFRKYIADGGDLSKYMVWGNPVEYIKAENGNYLLTSGWWGLARHFNYIGDMIMCIGWAVACAGPSHGFPWPPVSYIIYFWLMDIHRLFRDENRCAIKYKKDWVKYKEAVPRFLLPGIW